jgi:hypothetical protein
MFGRFITGDYGRCFVIDEVKGVLLVLLRLSELLLGRVKVIRGVLLGVVAGMFCIFSS